MSAEEMKHVDMLPSRPNNLLETEYRPLVSGSELLETADGPNMADENIFADVYGPDVDPADHGRITVAQDSRGLQPYLPPGYKPPKIPKEHLRTEPPKAWTKGYYTEPEPTIEEPQQDNPNTSIPYHLDARQALQREMEWQQRAVWGRGWK